MPALLMLAVNYGDVVDGPDLFEDHSGPTAAFETAAFETAAFETENHAFENDAFYNYANIEITTEQWIAVRHLMVSSLVRRGFPHHDAEDVAQDVAIKIAGNPSEFAPKLRDLANNRLFFIKMAFNSYLMVLRAERRRRNREELHSEQSCRFGADGGDTLDALELAEEAPLTSLQRSYLHAVLVEHRSPAEIAAVRGTTERAVRAVLQRAADAVGDQRRLSAA